MAVNQLAHHHAHRKASGRATQPAKPLGVPPNRLARCCFHLFEQEKGGRNRFLTRVAKSDKIRTWDDRYERLMVA
jgi:hypothetical protein